ncbi:MAG: type II toxin-antitoxin system VapC family toxin [Rickettsiales bacterium]
MIIAACNQLMVVDASIIAKYMLPSENSDSILQRIPDNVDKIAPSIVEFEISSLLCKHVRLGLLTKELAHKEFVGWQEAVRNEWIYISPPQDYISDAFSLACDIKHPFYDCCYLALAQQENCALITADKKLYERGKTIYQNIILVS